MTLQKKGTERNAIDKEQIIQSKEHPTRPPRLPGVIHRKGIKPIEKKKKV